MTQAERQAQTAEQYRAQVELDNQQLGDKYRATERDIMAEVPEAAREEAERLVTARVFYRLAKQEAKAKYAHLTNDADAHKSNRRLISRVTAYGMWGEFCGQRLAGALAVCAKEGKR